MSKLLVISILDMTDQQLKDYAEAVPNRTKDITAEKFLQDLQKGEQINVKYPDGSTTTYQIIKELN